MKVLVNAVAFQLKINILTPTHGHQFEYDSLYLPISCVCLKFLSFNIPELLFISGCVFLSQFECFTQPIYIFYHNEYG